MPEDTDDLLPSAAVLREAVAAQQQQLLASADVPISPSQEPNEGIGMQSRPGGYDSTNSSSISNSSSSSSSSSRSDSSKWPEQHDWSVQLGGIFSMGVKGSKPPVIVQVSSAVLSCRMEGMIAHSEWLWLLPLLWVMAMFQLHVLCSSLVFSSEVRIVCSSPTLFLKIKYGSGEIGIRVVLSACHSFAGCGACVFCRHGNA